MLWASGVRLLLRELALALLQRVSPNRLELLRRRQLARALEDSSSLLRDPSIRELLIAEESERPFSRRRGSFRMWGMYDRLETAAGTAALGSENRFTWSIANRTPIFDPILDPDVVELLVGLSHEEVNRGQRAKGLAWASIKRRAGEGAASGIGLAWPDPYLAERVAAEGARALDHLGGLPCLAAIGVIDERSATRAIYESCRGGFRVGMGYYHVWQVLACEAWLRGHAG
jgi:hypothetical protein